jgi:hypothetical protein
LAVDPLLPWKLPEMTTRTNRNESDRLPTASVIWFLYVTRVQIEAS